MKKTLRTLMMGMMALLGCTALTSCSNDDEPQVAQQEGQKGYVEFTLSRGADTRTAYAANKDGGLDVTWKDGDKMVVFYFNENEIVEIFDLVSGAGTTTGKFAKSDSDLKDKSGEVALEYLPGYDDTKGYRDQVIDFSEQSGLLESMGAYDVFMFSATLTNGQISAPKYKAAMAVYHFKANDINFGAGDGNKDFVFSEGTNAVNFFRNQKGPITVKGVSLTGGKLSKDLYVAVYASHAPTTLTVGSKTFELPTDKLEAGKVYTFAQEHLKAATPLTIEALAAGTITIKNPLGLVISYKLNSNDMVTSTEGDKSDITITDLAVGDKVQLFGNNKGYASSYECTNINCSESCKIKVYGNIMSLISQYEYSNMTALENRITFYALFGNNTGLTDASGLILPATTLAEYCYADMFRGCTSLTQAPALPATTLTVSCYRYMFSDCTALTQAPALPATTLAERCYQYMFDGCTALTEAPTLPATTLAEACYSDMFYGCTSLTQSPELPATTLAESCYAGMFAECTALTTSPALPATTLADYCYQYMFDGCSSLNFVTCLATYISASDCTDNWLNGVAASGTFTKAAGIEEDDWKAAGVPTRWTVKNYGE